MGMLDFLKPHKKEAAAPTRPVKAMPIAEEKPILQSSAQLIWPSSESLPPQTEILLPKKLFVSAKQEHTDDDQNVHSRVETVMMKTPGKLVKETSLITYSAHSIVHNTGAVHCTADISFGDLEALIRLSEDPNAAKYSGMTAENWKSYIETPIPSPDSTIYPTLHFGCFPAGQAISWYVLAIENNTALLLSEYGLDARPWHHTKTATPWEESDLCQWLNHDFMMTAFSASERSALTNADTGENKITLLCRKEAEQYLKDDSAITAMPTSHAKSQGAFHYSYSDSAPQYRKYVGNGLCWLKDTNTLGTGSMWASAVYWDGSFCSYPLDSENRIVRPMLRLNLEAAFGKETAAQLSAEYHKKTKPKCREH